VIVSFIHIYVQLIVCNHAYVKFCLYTDPTKYIFIKLYI